MASKKELTFKISKDLFQLLLVLFLVLSTLVIVYLIKNKERLFNSSSAYIPKECISGQGSCRNSTRYKCINGFWVLVERNARCKGGG